MVRLRRGLTQIPGVMVNRLNNDGQVVNTHALQSAHSANFKYRKELGETAVEGTGVRASILRNAASARRICAQTPTSLTAAASTVGRFEGTSS